MINWQKFLIAILLCVGGGWLFGLITREGVVSWYPLLNKPSWTPPNYIFPIAWTLLYTLMAISLYLVWISPRGDKKWPMALFGIQLGLNFVWSWLFFFLKSPLMGLVDISLLWVTIVILIVLFWKIEKWAGILLLPYIAWVTYAFALNLYIWLHN